MLMGVQLSGIQLESGLWYLVDLGFFFLIQSGSEWIGLCSKNILAEDIELRQQLLLLIFEDQTRLYN